MKSLILPLLILFFGFNYAGAVNNDNTTAATVTDFSGKVLVKKSDSTNANITWEQVKLYTPLEKNDTIKTESDSSAEITMEDGSIFKIEQNTELNLINLNYDAKTKKQNFIMKLFSGLLLSNAEKTGNPESHITIHTPTAVLSVRGTEFVVDIENEETTNVGVYSGCVSARNLTQDNQISNEETVVNPNQETQIKRFQRPLPPIAIRERILRHKENLLRLKERRKIIRQNWKSIINNRMKIRQEFINKLKENPQLREQLKEKIKSRNKRPLRK